MRSKRITALGLLAIVSLTACSEVNEIVDQIVPPEEQAELLLDAAVLEVVLPMAFLTDVVWDVFGQTPATSFLGISCPDTNGVCNASGDVTCTVDASNLVFDFDVCGVAADGRTVLIDGGLSVATVSPTDLSIALAALSFNAGVGLNGTLTADLSTCDFGWNITSGSSTTATGEITMCSEDYPASGSSLQITVDVTEETWIFGFAFDGTSTVDVTVTRDGSPVATCETDLDSFQSLCTAPE